MLCRDMVFEHFTNPLRIADMAGLVDNMKAHKSHIANCIEGHWSLNSQPIFHDEQEKLPDKKSNARSRIPECHTLGGICICGQNHVLNTSLT